MGNVESLPKWARENIQRLERERDHYKQLAESTLTGREKGPVAAMIMSGGDITPFYFPQGTAIRFELEDGLLEVAQKYRNGWANDEIEVRNLHRHGCNGMAFIPQVSNVMRVKLIKD